MTQNPKLCLNCGRSENMIPLVTLQYRGENAWICSQCLPILIHNPGRLADRLAGAENMDPAPPNDH